MSLIALTLRSTCERCFAFESGVSGSKSAVSILVDQTILYLLWYVHIRGYSGVIVKKI